MRFLSWFFRRDRAGATPPRDTIDPDGHVRPYIPHDTSTPFVAQRIPEEIDKASEIIRRHDLSPWDTVHAPPYELTDDMIPVAENALGLKLPSALLAALKVQNGGLLAKSYFAEDYSPLPFIQGVGRQDDSVGDSLQTMPKLIWRLLEGYLDDRVYQQWWDSFGGGIHPDWTGKPRIPEAILLLGDDLHWGIALNYVRSGRQGEPSVVHVEMEAIRNGDQILTEIAADFLGFLKMLSESERV
jgi:hypothetical protein